MPLPPLLPSKALQICRATLPPADWPVPWLALLWLAQSSAVAPPVGAVLFFRLRLKTWTVSRLQDDVFIVHPVILFSCLFFFLFHGWLREESPKEAVRCRSRGGFLYFSQPSPVCFRGPLSRLEPLTCGLSFRNTTACLLSTHVFDLSRRVFDSPFSWF